ncbi:2OG-Fe(II) oxygenase [Hyphomonas sp. WL0036]|uniref:prolyl hydroxylase family protein n=1 Tax=Hyphomonas sediminis TaxID=2866160 RepID=UPI001C80EA1C|nr:2OG-Fe(II) oxygenase [Hyphomonas sediminis]MBY9067680.1 2OG-Fe(II) oxygenase [Hyphomonas sediminis]
MKDVTVNDEWVTFTWVRLRSGYEPHDVKRQLIGHGFDDAAVRSLMRAAYDGRRPVEDVDYQALANAPITRRALSHPLLRRVPVSKAQLYVWPNFLAPQTCDALVALTDERLRASTTTDAFADPKIRTSRTSDIGSLGHNLVMQLDELMADALGVHWSYSDATQAQRYDTDQEYKAHYDYFPPGTRDYQVHCQYTGQRTWTFMIYLNDVEEGGGTRFRRLEKTIMPEKGKAVIWNNLNPDGTVNPHTIHHGMKVRKGSKYVVTKWFRERGWGEMFPTETYNFS